MKSECRLIRAQTILLALTLPVLGIASGLTQAQTTGRCVRAEIPETMVLPDGSRHAPGTMRICLTHRASPVTGFHEIRVDGHGKGLFQSRFGASEAMTEDGQAFLSFRRTKTGELILEGYAIPAGQKMDVFEIVPVAKKRRADAQHVARGLEIPRESDTEPVVLLASVSN